MRWRQQQLQHADGPHRPGPTAATTATLTGQVVSLNGGAPIGGIAVDANGVAATSDGQGMFTVTIPASGGPERFVLTAPQILSRTVFVSRTTHNLRLDVIRSMTAASTLRTSQARSE